MSERQNLYFIAIVPPQQVCDEINRFKKDLAERFHSKAALKVMPHITIKAPFTFPAIHHQRTLYWFDRLLVTVPVFHQHLKDFGAFDNRNHPVIYVNPVINPALEELQEQVIEHFISHYPDVDIMDPEFSFRPHMTVAYRDLQPVMFKEAWNEYKAKQYAASFAVTNFHLLQHNGRVWNIIQTCTLPANSAKQG